MISDFEAVSYDYDKLITQIDSLVQYRSNNIAVITSPGAYGIVFDKFENSEAVLQILYGLDVGITRILKSYQVMDSVLQKHKPYAEKNWYIFSDVYFRNYSSAIGTAKKLILSGHL